MAYFVGLNRGDAAYKMTVATSTQTKDVEIQINATNVPDKQTALQLLNTLADTLAQSGWPPV